MRADICIVGSGPSGQAVAQALSGSGAAVLMVDAGDVEADRWSRRFASAAMPSIGRHYPNAGDQASIRLGGTSDRWAIRLDPGADTGSGVRLHRLDPVDFKRRPTAGADGWPIGIADLEPYYRRAEARLGIPETGDPIAPISSDQRLETSLFWAVERNSFLSPDPASARIVSRCAIMSLIADRTGRITGAEAVTRNGETVRVSADVFVLAMGTVQTTRLLLDSPWTEAPSIANSSGLLGHYLTDHPQLVLGQLLLDVDADLGALAPLAPSVFAPGVLRWPNLISAARRSLISDWARVAVTLLPVQHVPKGLAVLNRLPRPTGARTGALKAAGELADRTRHGSLDPSFLRRLATVAGGADEVVASMLSGRLPGRQWSIENPHWAHLVEGGHRPAGFQIFAVAEQLPNPENRIVLSEERNALGGRRARVAWRWSAEDRRRVELSSDDVRQVLAGLHIGRVVPRRGRAAVHKINSHHPAGTARMSAKPTDGVVDPNLRAHDHPNLFIVGSAVFNTAGFANPTLTDVALGLRLGDHLAERSQPGDGDGRQCEPARQPTA
ncbi:MAG: GMC oxidoreductase [Acidimicrobiales bacterium]